MSLSLLLFIPICLIIIFRDIIFVGFYVIVTGVYIYFEKYRKYQKKTLYEPYDSKIIIDEIASLKIWTFLGVENKVLELSEELKRQL